jgi:hypothetical protein
MLKAVLAAALCCVACSRTVPPPDESLSQAIGLERDAWALGAQNDTQAHAAAELATEEIEQAMALIRQGKNAQADKVLLRAHADAELALQLTREAIVRQRVWETRSALMAAREQR